MLKRITAVGAALLLAVPVQAQMGHGGGHHPDTLPREMHQGTTHQGMTGHGMMAGQGMMGHGMMMACPMMDGTEDGMGMMGGGMMMGMASPAAVLHRGEALALTDEQVARLEEIRDDLAGTVQGHMTAAMEVHREAAEALEADTPDLDAYEAALERAAPHMVQAHVATARATERVRGVLTPEQWEQVRQHGTTGQPGMMQHHGGGGGTR